MEKSLVLIDGENVIRSWWTYCKNNNLTEAVDYVRLLKKVSEGTNLLRGIFYDGVPENIPVGKKRFLEALQHNNIQLRTKILKRRKHHCSNCNHYESKDIQKGVDVSLATDILRHSLQKSCDIVIVVSGDEDYKDAIECAKERGVKVWVAAFKHSLSKELRLSTDKLILLDDIFAEIKKISPEKP